MQEMTAYEVKAEEATLLFFTKDRAFDYAECVLKAKAGEWQSLEINTKFYKKGEKYGLTAKADGKKVDIEILINRVSTSKEEILRKMDTYTKYVKEKPYLYNFGR